MIQLYDIPYDTTFLFSSILKQIHIKIIEKPHSSKIVAFVISPSLLLVLK